MNVDKVLSQANLDSLGCKLWLPLNGDAKDYSGNSNDGSVNGMTYDKAVNGRKVGSFDGVNDYISLGNKFNPGTNDISVIGWFKPLKDNCTIYHKRYDFGSQIRWAHFLRRHSDGYLEHIYRDSTLYTLGSADVSNIDLNEWIHYGIIRDGAIARMYINCIEVDTVSVGTANFYTSDVNFEIGRQGTVYGNSEQAHMLIFDDIAISPQQIRKFYNATYIE